MMHNRSNVGESSWEWKSSPFELFNKREEPELFVTEFITYNQTLALRPFCFNNLQGKGNHSCSCLSVLKNGDDDSFYEAVAQYQVMFGNLKKDDQKMVEWGISMSHVMLPWKRKDWPMSIRK
jgi:hypothetical protein